MDVKDDSLTSGNDNSNLDPQQPSAVAMASAASLPATASLMAEKPEYGISIGQSMSTTLCSTEQKPSTTKIMQQATATVCESVGRETPLPRIKVEETAVSGVSSLGSDLPMKTALSDSSQISDSTPDLVTGNSNATKEEGQKHPSTQPLATSGRGSLATSAMTAATASTSIPPQALSPPKLKVEAPSTMGASSLGAAQSPKPAISVPQPSKAPKGPPSPPPPLKAVTMSHLRKKYTAELQYMLREFRKLERQLLGAKGIEESAGSRERREKLHSFILHLEDTIRQIDLGCRLEAEGKSTALVGVSGASVGDEAAMGDNGKLDSSALTNITREKEEEENVQKLEEHILANLLPVKVRLTKQLAAQQGASRNPAGMPAARRGMLQPAVEKGKGTFAAAAEQRRKQAEAIRAAAEEPLERDMGSSQFGKPLKGGGSSLTQKLHGSTLGSKSRLQATAAEGSALESDEEIKKRKILYAGMAPGSKQVHSSVSAAVGAHGIVVEDPALLSTVARQKVQQTAAAAQKAVGTSSVSPRAVTGPQHPPPSDTMALPSTKEMKRHAAKMNAAMASAASSKRRHDDFILTDEERKRLRKKRKRKQKRRDARRLEIERQRQVLLQQQAVQASQLPNKGGAPPSATKKVTKGAIANKNAGKKKGPRTVEYICALCSETYSSTCEANPWWTLTSHDCPKCRKTQVPRVDITSPANAIEYHPALLAHAEDTSGGNNSGAGAGIGVMHLNPTHISPSLAVSAPVVSSKFPKLSSDSDSGSDFSDDSDIGHLSDDSMDSDDSDLFSLSPGEEAEKERFGREYTGPTLTENESARLLTLISHASTCPGRHKSARHRDVCHSTKFLMLHVRDCPGTTSTFDVCPFPWCRKVKHLLYHLVACPRPQQCGICTPKEHLSPNLKALTGLNDFRRKKHRARMVAAMKAAAAAKARAAAAASRPTSRSAHHKKSAVPSSKAALHKNWTPPSAAVAKARANAAINAVKKPVVSGSRPLSATKQPVSTALSRATPMATSKVPASISAVNASTATPASTYPRAKAPAVAPNTTSLPTDVPAAPPSTILAAAKAARTAPAALNMPGKTAVALPKQPATETATPSMPTANALPQVTGTPTSIPATAPTTQLTAPHAPIATSVVAKQPTSATVSIEPSTSVTAAPSEPLQAVALNPSTVSTSVAAAVAQSHDGVAAALALAEAAPLSPAVAELAELGEATVSPTILGSGDEKSPEMGSVSEVPKDIPPRLKFPKLEDDAALIEDLGSSGQSEPENAAEEDCAQAIKETEGSGGTNAVVLKKAAPEGDAKVDGAPFSSKASTPSPPSEKAASPCAEEAEKKTEPVRIGC